MAINNINIHKQIDIHFYQKAILILSKEKGINFYR